MFQINNIFVIVMLEFVDCIRNTQPSNYFSYEFLNNPLFKILPEGYDICYMITRTDDIMTVIFYLYNKNNSDFDINAKIGFDIDFELDEIYIRQLLVNDYKFNLRRSGLGTYLVLCAIAYAKSFDIIYAKLEDLSGTNIYEKIGFVDYNHEMIGIVDDIYRYIDEYIFLYEVRLKTKLNNLTRYLTIPKKTYIRTKRTHKKRKHKKKFF